ncbi:MAG: hypothetical protein ACE5G2_07665 [Candidatus Krumholzibacteriia bacterium]
MSCSRCHTIWPQLTEEGRAFKEGGYEFRQRLEIDEDLTLENAFPVSARLNLRLADKRTSKRKATGELTDKDKQLKLRALHEVEVFFAGRAGERWSYFAEVEAEDEWPDPNGDAPGFQMQLATAAVQFKPNELVTLSGGYASPFYADNYNTVNYRKPARHAWAPAAKGFTPGESQFVSISGRPIEQLFLLAAYHGNAGQLEGKDAEDVSLRAAVDVIPELSVGGYMTFEKTFDGSRNISQGEKLRVGGDLQVAYERLNVHGLFGILDDRAIDKTETAFGVEANYLHPADRWAVGPVASVSGYTENDGDDTFVVGGFFLDFQVLNNTRLQAGWEGDLSVPDAIAHKESRITFVADVAF